MAELETKLAEARAKAMVERSKLYQEALESEKAVLATARGEAEVLLAEARASLDQEQETARAEFQTVATELSRNIASSILGRSVEG